MGVALASEGTDSVVVVECMGTCGFAWHGGRPCKVSPKAVLSDKAEKMSAKCQHVKRKPSAAQLQDSWGGPTNLALAVSHTTQL